MKESDRWVLILNAPGVVDLIMLFNTVKIAVRSSAVHSYFYPFLPRQSVQVYASTLGLLHS